MDRPETHTIRDAHIRIYNPVPGTDDASDMYVMEVADMGITVLVRQIRDEDGTPGTRVAVDVDGAVRPLIVSVGDVESVYE